MLVPLPLPSSTTSTSKRKRTPRTLEEVLQCLPEGYAIVEYPVLEIWLSHALASAADDGRVALLELDEDKLDVEQDGEGQASGSDSDSSSSSETESSSDDSGSEGDRVTSPVKKELQSSQAGSSSGPAARQLQPSAGLFVSAYESSSDDETTTAMQIKSEQPTVAAPKAPAVVSKSSGAAAPAATSKSLGMVAYSDSESEDEDDDADTDAGGLASVARALGMAPAQPAKRARIEGPASLERTDPASGPAPAAATAQPVAEAILAEGTPEYMRDEDEIDFD